VVRGNVQNLIYDIRRLTMAAHTLVLLALVLVLGACH